jgi:hypothetical protein
MRNGLHISNLKRERPNLYNNLTNFIRDSNHEVKLKYQEKCLIELWKIDAKKDFAWESYEGVYEFILEAELGAEFYHQESERIFYKLLNFLGNAPIEVRTEILCAYDRKLIGISNEHYWYYLDQYFKLLPEKFFSDIYVGLEDD